MVYENPTLSQKKSFDHYFAISYKVVENPLTSLWSSKSVSLIETTIATRKREKKKGTTFV